MHSLEALEIYTLFHQRWFESVHHYQPDTRFSEVFHALMPETWKLRRSGVWYVAQAPGEQGPDQGWKIHLSVGTQEAVAALEAAIPILLAEQVTFKFLLDPFIATLSNGKIWPRSGGGKFLTIYPNSLAHFYSLGNQLSATLQDFQGPYILSDRRWPGSKCVYYRYGGFSARALLQADGTRQHMIAKPSGELVKDRRTPYWYLPEWVKAPFPAGEGLADSGSGLDGGRFSITSALTFSNRGGVYKGVDHLTGKEVILKEARPFVEIGSQQLEATEALKKEYRLLESLADTGYFVRPVSFFQAWEHAFLVEEFIPGTHLGQFTILNNPIYSKDITPESVDAYFDEVRALWLQIVKAIEAAHAVGIVLQDLSFTNILVHEGKIHICDLETAQEKGVDEEVGLRTPGMYKAEVSAMGNDYYALGSILFGSIILAYAITDFHPAGLHRFMKHLSHDIALPEALAQLIINLIEQPEECKTNSDRIVQAIAQLPFGEGGATLRVPNLGLPLAQRFNPAQRSQLQTCARDAVQGVIGYLHGTASPERNDRLFPSDLALFETNPLSVAYGASGVLHAMQQLEGVVPQHLIDWVLKKQVSNQNYPPGLYLGQAGIAWTLCEIGEKDAAKQMMESLRESLPEWDSPNVIYGAAGYGMACLKLWKMGLGDEFLASAIASGEFLLSTYEVNEKGIFWPDEDGKVAVGYAFGASGIALFLLYLSLATGDPDWRKVGRAALAFDLAQGVYLEGQFSGFPTQLIDPAAPPVESAVLSCYWNYGSAGVGTTLVRYLAVAPDQELADWLDRLVEDTSRKYTAFPQMFVGLAGLGNFLLDVWQLTGDNQHYLAAAQVAEGVLLFRIDCEEGITFPGDQLRRECADFATGAAGIALFLNRFLNSETASSNNYNFVVDELLPGF